ncbi:hypothetical protein [Methylobacterium trifolii]|uniref:DUF2845 domain-containing protein n=1 Tax=Methylobacterium trifolii TaxID=1003092 RepID=A0ABQ4U322_9HYPH|nr:hypothetical protein [Methylobacterium trifolii]GJE61661.1 hypothetical protein MPOCJGCO_3784 [Methylobacterium trifolii]
MLARLVLISGTALLALSSASSARDCTGTFIRHSCKLGAAEGICAYPREKGDVEDFMGWEVDEGVRGYVVYRMGAYPAKDIKLKPGCTLKPY